MGYQIHPSTKFKWRITGFTKLTVKKYYSNTFVVGGAKWKLFVFPSGDNTGHLSLHLTVAHSETLPLGWSREAKFCLTLVNQLNRSLSITEDTHHTFNSVECDWGFKFLQLSKFKKKSGGFLLIDTVAVEANIEVISVHPPTIDTINRFDTHFASLEEFIKNNTVSTTKEGSSSEKILGSNSKTPSLEEIKQAKQSLKECLNDPFKPNIKEKLDEALSTLSLATEGLSDGEQKEAVQFWANFDDFILDCLIFEQENTEYKSQNLVKSRMFMEIEKSYKTHISYRQSLDDLSSEEEELTKRIQEVQSKRIKLMSDWDILTKKSVKAKSNYKIQEKKVADAEKRKRSIEEKMPLATMRWATLKKQFG